MHVPYTTSVPNNALNTWANQQNSYSQDTNEQSSFTREEKCDKNGRRCRKRRVSDREKQKKPTARTLGELVEEAKEKEKKKSRSGSFEKERMKDETEDEYTCSDENDGPENMKEDDLKCDEINQASMAGNSHQREGKPQFFDGNYHQSPICLSIFGDVPLLGANELKDEIVLDEYEFDPNTMKVKESSQCMYAAGRRYNSCDGEAVLNLSTEMRLNEFNNDVLEVLQRAKDRQVLVPRSPTPPLHHKCKCGHDDSSSSSSSEDEKDDNEKQSDRQKNIEILRKEVHRKQTHPSALSPDIIFNEKGMSNDGPVCRCSIRSRKEGLRHSKYVGEKFIPLCNPKSSNSKKLYHYVLKVGVTINSYGLPRTQIMYNNAVYKFEGYSVFFHRPLPEVFPAMPTSRWTTDFDFEFVKESIANCYTVGELEAFYSYLYDETLDFYDVSRYPDEDPDHKGCPYFHIMPRFVYEKDGRAELLAMCKVIDYLVRSFKPLVSRSDEEYLLQCTEEQFRKYIGREKNQIILCPLKKPSAIRVDSFVRVLDTKEIKIMQNTLKPVAYIAVHNPELHRLSKRLSKMRHLHAVKKNTSEQVRMEIENLQVKIDSLKNKSNNVRCVSVLLPSHLFYKCGMYPDVVPHSLVLLLACQHARLHWSFDVLEEKINHKFKNRLLLELSLTHPSFKHNYGVTIDHAKNTLLNCGYRRKYSTLDEKKEKKRGIFRLLEIMSLSGQSKSAISPITHNERLEYLGDAVVEMVVSIRLYLLLPLHNEGVLATYRSALVQNRNLATLAQNIGLQHWLLFAHGPDLCHESDFRHALANSFEAIMAAVYLDAGIDKCDRLFSKAMFGNNEIELDRWLNVSDEELRCDEYKDGDRELIPKFEVLQSLTSFENSIGFRFKHIRLLAKAFTRRNIPYNCISKGNNQRLEWLGDTVLQLVVTDYLYKHFPHHHEGHLSLLRTCIVSNKTQSVICDDLNMGEYLVKPIANRDKVNLRVKDKADLVEAFIGALYLDGGLGACKAFIKVCFLPRLKLFIEANKWNDPKSQLQQLCLTMRNPESKEPAMPTYRVISAEGPSNTRRYKVAVYFRERRLAVGEAGNMHSAEMDAAKRAIIECKELANNKFSSHQRFAQLSRTNNTY
ncbi:unnamed protein product [Auanema sp. JU1783]|nr:unnamed protein product [Auanema sp. JU1783]